MDSEQDLTLIDAYLNGSLSAEEQTAMAQRLANDSAFQELFEFTRSVQRVARQQERQRIKAMLQAVDDESAALEPVAETGPKVIPITSYPQAGTSNRARSAKTFQWPFATIGIAAALVATLLVWQPTRSSNEEVFAAYAETSASTATLPGLAGSAGTRGPEMTLNGFTANETEALAQAVDKLQAKDYQNAKVLLKQLVLTKGEQPILLRNLAVAQLNSNEVAEAVRNLENLSKQLTLPAKDEVKYDLALGYIKQGNLSQARPLLQEIAHSDSKLATSASAILDKMRWWF